jgi:glucose-6-phosphate 1-dehydrogenase
MSHPQERPILVLFGGTGDLARRKLLPALEALSSSAHFPGGFEVVCTSRRPEDETFAAFRRHLDPGFLSRFHFRQIGYDADGFQRLRETCDSLAGPRGIHRILFHMAVPPSAVGEIAGGLVGSGLVRRADGSGRSRLLVEKPFGVDSRSAGSLDRLLLSHVEEQQICRIDHYLGKPAVYSPIGVRMAYPELEWMWNGGYIRYVRIISRESLGCGERSGYFDGIGIVRDMIQSHLLQLLALVAMDLPSDAGGGWEDFRERKTRAMMGIMPIEPGARLCPAIRGQYTEGVADGTVCSGYLKENGVRPDSRTETYAALRFEHADPRWKGVPFWLEAGKRMSRKETEIEIGFHDVRSEARLGRLPGVPRRLVIRVQPGMDAYVEYSGGARMRLEDGLGPLSGLLPAWRESQDQDGYRMLLGEALKGRSSLFVPSKEVEHSWRCLDPLLKAWAGPEGDFPIHRYGCGIDGPRLAQAVFTAMSDPEDSSERGYRYGGVSRGFSPL